MTRALCRSESVQVVWRSDYLEGIGQGKDIVVEVGHLRSRQKGELRVAPSWKIDAI